MLRNLKKRKHLLRVPNRRIIFEHIRGRPGTYMRQMQRDLQMPMSTLEYHLRQLEVHGLVVSRKKNRFKAYFTPETLDRRDKDYLYFLRQRMPRQIAIEIYRNPGISLKNLVERVPVTASTLAFHLKKLVRSDIVFETMNGRQKTFRLANPRRLEHLLATYCNVRPEVFSADGLVFAPPDPGAPFRVGNPLRPDPAPTPPAPLSEDALEEVEDDEEEPAVPAS